MQPQRDFGKPRLFIDRVFTLRGIGTVVTGTLTGGQLRRGQRIVVQPTKSRNTHSFDSESRRRNGSRAAGNAHGDQSAGSPRSIRSSAAT